MELTRTKVVFLTKRRISHYFSNEFRNVWFKFLKKMSTYIKKCIVILLAVKLFFHENHYSNNESIKCGNCQLRKGNR